MQYRSGRSGRRRSVALFAAAGVSATFGFAGLAATGASASSHREAPLISATPRLDNTDTYAFVSPDDPSKVTLIANWIPMEEPAGGPNFYPFAEHAGYYIKVDSNGDAIADISYKWVFTNHYKNRNTFLYNTGQVTSLYDKDLNFTQTYTLTREDAKGKHTLLSNAPVAPSYVGIKSMPNYASLRAAAIKSYGNTRKSFAGQADDPFFLDLRVFDLLYGADFSEIGNDTLAGYNVNSIALQVPKADLLGGGDPIFGMWSTTTRMNANGSEVQVSRLGNPLVNEVVIPVKDKDKFNASRPVNDPQFLDYVTKPELPNLIQAIYGIPKPKEPRNDLVSVFLTGVDGLNKDKTFSAPGEEMRLNTSIKPSANENRLGVIAGDNAGYPNGRRLGDDVVDISLQVVEGELVGNPNDLGDAVNHNDRYMLKHFPYVALPWSGSRPDGTKGPAGTTLINGGIASNPTPSTPGLPLLPITGALLASLLTAAGVATLRTQRRRATAAA